MQKSNIEIWNSNDILYPLEFYKNKEIIGDVAIIVVNRDRPDLTDSQYLQLKSMVIPSIKTDIYVIEMGSTYRSKYENFYYEDMEYRGKTYGHNVGLRYALSNGRYKYYWILMNDLIFNLEQAPLKTMFNIMNNNKNIGILSPTEINSSYPSCRPKKDVDFHVVSTTDYLSLFVRGDCIDHGCFLNPEFKYCWGAIHEFAHKINKIGYKVAYCDRVTMIHLGGTTYGKIDGIPKRSDYQVNAKKFASEYFSKTYGKDWEILFTKYMPKEVVKNTFVIHKKKWG